MKNKLIKIVCACLMLVTFSVLFMGCGKGQITIVQIEEAIKKAEKPVLGDSSTIVSNIVLYTSNTDKYSETCLEWQRKFENNDIDTTNFMSMSDMYYRVQYDSTNSNRYDIYVFKFSEKADAKNCCKKLNKLDIVEGDYWTIETRLDNEKYTAKQYGNLVVYTYDKIASYVFGLIDNIKAK